MTTANLALQDNDSVVQYTSVGEDDFLTTFPVLTASELKVSVDQAVAVYGVDFTITDGLGEEGGVTVHFPAGTTPGQLITLWLDMPIERQSGYQAGAATLMPEDLNADAVQGLRIDQMLRRDIGRALRLPVDDPLSGQDMQLPVASSRLNKLLYFNPVTGAAELLSLTDIAGIVTAFSQSLIGATLWPRTAREVAAGVMPLNYAVPELHLERYGGVADDATDNFQAFEDAIAVALVNGGDIILGLGTYRTSGDHLIANSHAVKIVGQGVRATWIRHTGDNVCFWFRAVDLLHSAGSGCFHLLVFGNAGNSARFMRISDGWNQTAQDVIVWDYTGTDGSAFELYNYERWTEGWLFRDVMVRNSRRGWIFNRSGGGLETDSFGFGRMENCSMVLQLANCYAMFVPDQPGLPKSPYSAAIQLQVWHVAGGGNYAIFVVGAGNIMTGKLDLTCDSLPAPDGSDYNLVYAFDGGFIQMEGRIDPNHIQTSDLPKFIALIKQAPADTTFTGTARPMVYVKGAKLKVGGFIAMGDTGLYESGELPPHSCFRVTLTFQGFNTAQSQQWLVTTNVDNVVAYCEQVGGLVSADILVQGPGGASGGSFSVGDGNQFEISIDGTASPNDITWSADIEAL